MSNGHSSSNRASSAPCLCGGQLITIPTESENLLQSAHFVATPCVPDYRLPSPSCPYRTPACSLPFWFLMSPPVSARLLFLTNPACSYSTPPSGSGSTSGLTHLQSNTPRSLYTSSLSLPVSALGSTSVPP
ncbi:unnamed protein product [Boreogadus saida]